MKAYLFFLSLIGVLLLSPLKGQKGVFNTSAEYENTTHYYNGDELWINDTISYYESTDDNWYPSKRLVVLSRDGLGQELETVMEFYDIENDTWKTKIKHKKSYYYFQDAHFLKESNTLIWNNYARKWVTTSKNTFDKSGRIQESFNYDWHAEHMEPLDGTRSVYTYGDEGNLVINENHVWDNATQSWNKTDRISLVTDPVNRTRNEEREIWDSSKSKWVLFNTKQIKTGSDGKVIEEVISTYDPIDKEVVLKNTTTLKYNPEGKITETIKIKDLGYRKTGMRELNLITNAGLLFKNISFNLEPNTQRWIPYQEMKYKYDESGNPVNIVKRYWNAGEDLWVNQAREDFIYVKGLLFDHFKKIWDVENHYWVNDVSKHNEFSLGNLTTSIQREWDPAIAEWKDTKRKTLRYSEFGKSYEFDEKWERSLNDWIGTFEGIWTFDETGNITGYEMQEFDKEGSSVLKEKATFGWHMFALSKTEHKDNYTIEVFPNPTKGVLHIKSIVGSLSRVAILDQAGHLLEAISLDQASTTIDVSHLPSGNYFLECITGIQTNTFKVVKL